MLRPLHRTEIIDALRRGTMPRFGLDKLAKSLNEELDTIALG
jgi:hypothetical protein